MKEIRVCKTCGIEGECYQNHLECCKCYGKKAKLRRMENEQWLMNSREYQRQYYWNNLEKCRAYSRKYWHERHDAKIAAGLIKPKKKQTREEFNAHRRAYYQKNIQKMRDNAKRYREAESCCNRQSRRSRRRIFCRLSLKLAANAVILIAKNARSTTANRVCPQK